MGAGCSTGSAAKVQDSVKPAAGRTAGDITELSKEAQEQLKVLQSQNPDTLSAVDQEKLKNLMKADQEKRADDDVRDQDQVNDDVPSIKHQELWLAVEMNEPEKVASCLEAYEEKAGEELKESELYDHTGNTVIHKAASLGHAEILILLLERTGAKPDLLNSSLASPLHLACKNNRVDAAKFLIGCGVDANLPDEHGQVPLLICCIHGNFDLARMLIEASTSGHLPEPLEVDIKDQRGLSPLNCAAIKGDFDLTKLLIINGSANVDGTSPKGCTPLLYAARGGYAEVVRFLILRGASALRQDNAGGTVLHHAIEKGHIDVLNVLQEHGVDVHSAIEIPDNAGRTAIFEAVDNHESAELLTYLTKTRKEGGFDAEANIMNYNGQTPLFSAAREGNIEVVKVLVEQCWAKVDLTQGELFKEEFEEQDGGNYQSLEEKFFMDAYKNCMTPLQVATVLGYDDIMIYLIEHGANPNLQTKIKGYSCLHLAVLANKPEVIIELLTKTQANPYLPDFGGRTLQDMVEIFIPSYLDSFKTLLENLQFLKQGGLEEADTGAGKGQEESLAGLANKGDGAVGEPVVATHYYNPDDERSLQGVGADAGKINELYNKQADGEKEEVPKEDAEAETDGGDKKSFHKRFIEMDEGDIKIDSEAKPDPTVDLVFNKKVALALVATDWKYKEIALKIIYKQAEKLLDMQMKKTEQQITTEDITRACTAAVSLTCREKVIKVFSISLQLLNLLISSTKIEKSGVADVLKNSIVEKNVVLKLLQKSEEGNTRITNKIHEALLDLSFNPEVGEALTSSFILQRIQAHNRANQQKQAQKNQQASEEPKAAEHAIKIETEASLGSYKGLLAQLALLYKFINSFGIASRTRGPLSVKDILRSVIPAVSHPNQDVRNASGKILLDVQKLSGCVTEEELQSLTEKARNALLEKLKKVEVEKNLNESNARMLQNNQNLKKVQAIQEEDDDETDCAEVPETISMNTPTKADTRKAQLLELKAAIEEKGSSKDWQERELAVKALQEVFRDKHGALTLNPKEALDDRFLQNCLILLKTCLEEQNMTVYLEAVQAASLFFEKTLSTDVVHGSLQSLVQPVVLRTTDTNTRIRKKSVDLIYQIWDFRNQPGGGGKDKLKLNQLRDSQEVNEMANKTDSICQIIASVICDPQNGEKAIIGRLGLFVKRAQQIEGSTDLVSKPLQMVLGKNYEQLTEFACQWISHKNTKVRQNALKLIIEICRINCMDPRGVPFKQRIVNFILGLRPSQRDPLVVKINETCLKHIVKNTSPGRAGDLEQYINVNELELNLVTKHRSASMDHVNAKRRLQSASRGSGTGEAPGGPGDAGKSAMLPSIGGVRPPGPGIIGLAQPTSVLPHSPPLSEEEQAQHRTLIDFFGIQIITCFISKNWSTRQAAILKVEEQLHNIDPNRRDAMSAEINRQNMPAEISFKTFLEFMVEGLKDPVLKNYLALLGLLQKALPTFFRYIQPHQIKADLQGIIRDILRKTSDLKQKIRESSINFCLYLSHQSPVGPEYMVAGVLAELDSVQNESSNAQSSNKESGNVTTNFGNSHLISACLGLLNEYQIQSRLLSADGGQEALLGKFMDQVNLALRHQNPQVRKEAEKLFRTLYGAFGQPLEAKLLNQKPQLMTKLLNAAKQDALANAEQNAPRGRPGPGQPGDRPKSKAGSQQRNPVAQAASQEQKLEAGVQRAQDQIRDTVINQAALQKVLEGAEQHLQALKLPNPKQRQKAIVEIKKAISKKIVQQMSQEKARELFEPLTLLMRQLLQDEDSDIYLESLNLLKFVVGSLAPNLSTLDLHLMMGSFIGIIVTNTATSGNMRIQVASDKVVVFFAKHQNIGPFVVAKEVTKNIDKINKTLQMAGANKAALLVEKRQVLLRFYGLLALLLTQFSIVLCYQQDFYTKCLECLADSMILSNGAGAAQEGEDVAVKNLCSQIVINLYAVDYKLLDNSVGKLSDLNRKTPLRKVIIEHESQQKQGKGYLDMGKQQDHAHSTAQLNPGAQPGDAMRDTQMSFASSLNRQSLFSPGSSAAGRERGQSPGGFGASQYDKDWNGRFQMDASHSTLHDSEQQPHSRQRQRMMSLGEKRTPGTNGSQTEQYLSNHPISTLTQSSWRRQKDVLPSVEGAPALNRTGVLLPQIGPGGVGGGLGTSYRFEAGNQPPQADAGNQKGKQPKFKAKATGGAGFSSGGSASGAPTGLSSTYEPSGPSVRRTPRRTLGVLNTNANGFGNSGVGATAGGAVGSSPTMPSPHKAGVGGGLGGASQISWPSQAGKNTSTLDSSVNAPGAQPTQGPVKPPLYVPTRRQPSGGAARRSTDKGAKAASTGPQNYVSKTGFSSLGGPAAPTDNVPKKENSGTGGFGGGYVPSALHRRPSK